MPRIYILCNLERFLHYNLNSHIISRFVLGPYHPSLPAYMSELQTKPCKGYVEIPNLIYHVNLHCLVTKPSPAVTGPASHLAPPRPPPSRGMLRTNDSSVNLYDYIGIIIGSWLPTIMA
jgi:hypothetical protein